MKARQLEVFRTIMRCGTLIGAARVLNVSQPALSQILVQTEDALGFRLFERVRGRLVPTAEAEQLYPEAERIFRDLEELRRYAGDLKQGKAGLVRIAASAPASLSIVPRALKSYRAAHPDVRILSFVVPVELMIEMLHRGQADLGIAMNDTPQALLDTEKIGRSEIICLVQKDHRLVRNRHVGFAELAGETLVTYRSESLPGRLIGRAAALDGCEVHPEVEIDVSIIAASFVQQGIGVALVDGLLPWASFPDLVTRPFRPKVELPVCVLTSGQRRISRHQNELRRHVRDAVRTLAGDPGWTGILSAV